MHSFSLTTIVFYTCLLKYITIKLDLLIKIEVFIVVFINELINFYVDFYRDVYLAPAIVFLGPGCLTYHLVLLRRGTLFMLISSAWVN